MPRWWLIAGLCGKRASTARSSRCCRQNYGRKLCRLRLSATARGGSPNRGMKMRSRAPSGSRITVRALGLGAFGRTQRGQAAFDDGRESPRVLWPPLRLAWLRCERGSVGVVCPWFSRVVGLDEGSGW